MVEVELKLRIVPSAWPTIREELKRMRYCGSITNDDIYYDTRDYDLLQQAAFVRVRNNHILEFKFNESADIAHVQCTERAFCLEPEPHQARQMNALFARFLPNWQEAPAVGTAFHLNEMSVLAHITNNREQYVSGNLVVCVDHVEGLGEFLEVESQVASALDTNDTVLHLQEFVANLALERVPVGYVELLLQHQNPEAYQHGKYQLKV